MGQTFNVSTRSGACKVCKLLITDSRQSAKSCECGTQSTDSRAISQEAVALQSVGISKQSFNMKVGNPVSDYHQQQNPQWSATLADKAPNDASRRGEVVESLDANTNAIARWMNVHAALSALWTEAARLHAEDQRLFDRIHQISSAVAQKDSTLGFQRRVCYRSRPSSPDYYKPRL
ncbi:uncharacterized protein PHALS_13227 [Plasmopara halstedii]|uniref:Uncharacterized protein n=1 Tax=Plasmopara halstedii TaxID=4781 RepID=A0A0P1APN9_PLAHL|nr:uncharacterized protein PHALS_13227 [Plasmopara halstedii]CEG43001.1 hypothetical protein PHALS_13227 [Plasmopara halstedii]|eukprot:XP_024579370.1 hypothetical protein PHALS_13227 [Plasmopara halstedii]